MLSFCIRILDMMLVTQAAQQHLHAHFTSSMLDKLKGDLWLCSMVL